MAMKVMIRKFRKGDEYGVAKIIRDANRITLKKFYSPSIIRQMCSDANAKIIRIKAKEKNFKVATFKNKVVGVIGSTDNRIRSFFVSPSFQGKGVGRALIDHLEREIKKLKTKFIQLNSSLYAVEFYKHFGYKIIKNIKAKTKSGLGFEVVLMKKFLSKP